MSVYYIAEHIITDPVKFEEYRVKVAPMIASYGGRYITKAGSHKFPESPHWKPERVVIIEFPSMERLNAWYTSTERMDRKSQGLSLKLTMSDPSLLCAIR